MKIRNFFLVIALILTISLAFFLVETRQNFISRVEAAAGSNVTGFAWFGANCTDPTEATCGAQTDPAGWISFNDTDPLTCEGVSYGVNVDYNAADSRYKISGSAFVGVGENSNNADCNSSEDSLGWLYFDADIDPDIPDTPTCGANGYPPDYCFPARISWDEVQGWAPIVTNSGEVLTWVRFRERSPIDYRVKINSDGSIGTVGTADHYAWSGKGSEEVKVGDSAIGAGLGWIDFSPAGAGIDFPDLILVPDPFAFNARGWAWVGTNCTEVNELTRGDNLCDLETTDPIGWISFNHDNTEITCDGAFYGVNVDYKASDPIDSISGSAFAGVGENPGNADCNSSEDSLGWLYFDADIDPDIPDTPTCGANGYPSNFCFSARVIDDEVRGWAPIVSNSGDDVVTWVRFKATNPTKYSIKIDINGDGSIGTAGLSDHYAWSGKGSEVKAGAIGAGFGWIDFARVLFPFNYPPYPASQVISYEEYCIDDLAGQGIIGFQWIYTDADFDAETQFEFKVNDVNDPDDPSPEINWLVPCVGSCESGTVNSQLVSVTGAPALDKITYNTTYYWWVRLEDARGRKSDWVQGIAFTTPQHAFPAVSFSWTPAKVSKNEDVTFTDTSTIYGGASVAIWDWEFPADATLVTPPPAENQETVQFTSLGAKSVKLTITDNTLPTGYSCDASASISVKPPLPTFKEVLPR